MARRYQIFWEVVGLERGPLSLVSTIDELLGRNSSGSGLENREYGRGDSFRWPRDTLYRQKLALTSPTCGDRSVGIVRLRTKTTEFFLFPLRPVMGFLLLFGEYAISSYYGVKRRTYLFKTYINDVITMAETDNWTGRDFSWT
jgi:hypothetical protein